MRKIAFLLIALTWLTACHDNDEDTSWETPETATRTVMVYMAGENNLTIYNNYRYLNNDLKEMIEGSKHLGDNERLLVFVDSMNWKQAGKPVILELHGGEATVKHEFSEDFYSCDPSRFKEVLQWMTTNAKADSYGLALWGHANGWLVSSDTIADGASRAMATRAYGQDDGRDMAGGASRWMNITQMARVMETLPKMSFIFADCCNMMCAEVGYELRNVTDYIIGSPAEIPGDGAPYDRIMPYLYKNGNEMYKGIIDNYYNYYLADYQSDPALKGYSVPLSVIETKYMDQLAGATYDVLGSLAPLYPESPDLSGIAFYLYYDAPVMYDMKAVIKANAPADDYARWENSFRLAVPYSRMSMEWMTIYTMLELSFSSFNKDEASYGCVSMFVPRNTQMYNLGTFHFNNTYKVYGWSQRVNWQRFGW